jgi:hypothetical protein
MAKRFDISENNRPNTIRLASLIVTVDQDLVRRWREATAEAISLEVAD